MSTAPQLLFSIRAEGYGALTVESLTALGDNTNKGTLLEPPIRQPFSEIEQLNQQDPGPLGVISRLLSKLVFGRPWNVWFNDVWRWVTASNPGLSTVQFLCPSVDETDSEWYGVGTMNDTDDPATVDVTFTGQSRYGVEAAVTDGGSGYTAATFTVESQGGEGRPATGTATIQGGEVVALPVTFNGYGLVAPLVVVISGDGTGATGIAEPGRQWGVGDFILWNDPTINSTDHLHQYELDQIANIVVVDDTHATFTLARASSSSPAGFAQYGSKLNTHTGKQIYRLINKAFYQNFDPGNGPQVIPFGWPNMTVAAVLAQAPGINSVLFNLAPGPYLPGTTTPNPLVTPPAPGLRTMNGAAYTTLGISGQLSTAATSFAIIGLQANANSGPDSIRTIHARVKTAPVGATTFNGNANAGVVIYVCFVMPDGTVWLIDTIVIDVTKTESWASTNTPTQRQMPYHPFWPKTAPNFDWPPNRLPKVTSGLTLPFTVDSTMTMPFAPDAYIDFIVAQVGTSVAGADLTVTVQN